MADKKTITLPDVGDFKDIEIIEILVAPGDEVEVEQSIIVLESDKATMEIPSPEAGTHRKSRRQGRRPRQRGRCDRDLDAAR